MADSSDKMQVENQDSPSSNILKQNDPTTTNSAQSKKRNFRQSKIKSVPTSRNKILNNSFAKALLNIISLNSTQIISFKHFGGTETLDIENKIRGVHEILQTMFHNLDVLYEDLDPETRKREFQKALEYAFDFRQKKGDLTDGSSSLLQYALIHSVKSWYTSLQLKDQYQKLGEDDRKENEENFKRVVNLIEEELELPNNFYAIELKALSKGPKSVIYTDSIPDMQNDSPNRAYLENLRRISILKKAVKSCEIAAKSILDGINLYKEKTNLEEVQNKEFNLATKIPIKVGETKDANNISEIMELERYSLSLEDKTRQRYVNFASEYMLFDAKAIIKACNLYRETWGGSFDNHEEDVLLGKANLEKLLKNIENYWNRILVHAQILKTYSANNAGFAEIPFIDYQGIFSVTFPSSQGEWYHDETRNSILLYVEKKVKERQSYLSKTVSKLLNPYGSVKKDFEDSIKKLESHTIELFVTESDNEIEEMEKNIKKQKDKITVTSKKLEKFLKPKTLSEHKADMDKLLNLKNETPFSDNTTTMDIDADFIVKFADGDNGLQSMFDEMIWDGGDEESMVIDKEEEAGNEQEKENKKKEKVIEHEIFFFKLIKNAFEENKKDDVLKHNVQTILVKILILRNYANYIKKTFFPLLKELENTEKNFLENIHRRYQDSAKDIVKSYNDFLKALSISLGKDDSDNLANFDSLLNETRRGDIIRKALHDISKNRDTLQTNNLAKYTLDFSKRLEFLHSFIEAIDVLVKLRQKQRLNEEILEKEWTSWDVVLKNLFPSFSQHVSSVKDEQADLSEDFKKEITFTSLLLLGFLKTLLKIAGSEIGKESFFFKTQFDIIKYITKHLRQYKPKITTEGSTKNISITPLNDIRDSFEPIKNYVEKQLYELKNNHRKDNNVLNRDLQNTYANINKQLISMETELKKHNSLINECESALSEAEFSITNGKIKMQWKRTISTNPQDQKRAIHHFTPQGNHSLYRSITSLQEYIDAITEIIDSDRKEFEKQKINLEKTKDEFEKTTQSLSLNVDKVKENLNAVLERMMKVDIESGNFESFKVIFDEKKRLLLESAKKILIHHTPFKNIQISNDTNHDSTVTTWKSVDVKHVFGLENFSKEEIEKMFFNQNTLEQTYQESWVWFEREFKTILDYHNSNIKTIQNTLQENSTKYNDEFKKFEKQTGYGSLQVAIHDQNNAQDVETPAYMKIMADTSFVISNVTELIETFSKNSNLEKKITDFKTITFRQIRDKIQKEIDTYLSEMEANKKKIAKSRDDLTNYEEAIKKKQVIVNNMESRSIEKAREMKKNYDTVSDIYFKLCESARIALENVSKNWEFHLSAAYERYTIIAEQQNVDLKKKLILFEATRQKYNELTLEFKNFKIIVDYLDLNITKNIEERLKNYQLSLEDMKGDFQIYNKEKISAVEMLQFLNNEKYEKRNEEHVRGKDASEIEKMLKETRSAKKQIEDVSLQTISSLRKIIEKSNNLRKRVEKWKLDFEKDFHRFKEEINDKNLKGLAHLGKIENTGVSLNMSQPMAFYKILSDILSNKVKKLLEKVDKIDQNLLSEKEGEKNSTPYPEYYTSKLRELSSECENQINFVNKRVHDVITLTDENVAFLEQKYNAVLEKAGVQSFLRHVKEIETGALEQTKLLFSLLNVPLEEKNDGALIMAYKGEDIKKRLLEKAFQETRKLQEDTANIFSVLTKFLHPVAYPERITMNLETLLERRLMYPYRFKLPKAISEFALDFSRNENVNTKIFELAAKIRNEKEEIKSKVVLSDEAEETRSEIYRHDHPLYTLGLREIEKFCIRSLSSVAYELIRKNDVSGGKLLEKQVEISWLPQDQKCEIYDFVSYLTSLQSKDNPFQIPLVYPSSPIDKDTLLKIDNSERKNAQETLEKLLTVYQKTFSDIYNDQLFENMRVYFNEKFLDKGKENLSDEFSAFILDSNQRLWVATTSNWEDNKLKMDEEFFDKKHELDSYCANILTRLQSLLPFVEFLIEDMEKKSGIFKEVQSKIDDIKDRLEKSLDEDRKTGYVKIENLAKRLQTDLANIEKLLQNNENFKRMGLEESNKVQESIANITETLRGVARLEDHYVKSYEETSVKEKRKDLEKELQQCLELARVKDRERAVCLSILREYRSHVEALADANKALQSFKLFTFESSFASKMKSLSQEQNSDAQKKLYNEKYKAFLKQTKEEKNHLTKFAEGFDAISEYSMHAILSSQMKKEKEEKGLESPEDLLKKKRDILKNADVVRNKIKHLENLSKQYIQDIRNVYDTLAKAQNNEPKTNKHEVLLKDATKFLERPPSVAAEYLKNSAFYLERIIYMAQNYITKKLTSMETNAPNREEIELVFYDKDIIYDADMLLAEFNDLLREYDKALLWLENMQNMKALEGNKGEGTLYHVYEKMAENLLNKYVEKISNIKLKNDPSEEHFPKATYIEEQNDKRLHGTIENLEKLQFVTSANYGMENIKRWFSEAFQHFADVESLLSNKKTEETALKDLTKARSNALKTLEKDLNLLTTDLDILRKNFSQEIDSIISIMNKMAENDQKRLNSEFANIVETLRISSNSNILQLKHNLSQNIEEVTKKLDKTKSDLEKSIQTAYDQAKTNLIRQENIKRKLFISIESLKNCNTIAFNVFTHYGKIQNDSETLQTILEGKLKLANEHLKYIVEFNKQTETEVKNLTQQTENRISESESTYSNPDLNNNLLLKAFSEIHILILAPRYDNKEIFGKVKEKLRVLSESKANLLKNETSRQTNLENENSYAVSVKAIRTNQLALIAKNVEEAKNMVKTFFESLDRTSNFLYEQYNKLYEKNNTAKGWGLAAKTALDKVSELISTERQNTKDKLDDMVKTLASAEELLNQIEFQLEKLRSLSKKEASVISTWQAFQRPLEEAIAKLMPGISSGIPDIVLNTNASNGGKKKHETHHQSGQSQKASPILLGGGNKGKTARRAMDLYVTRVYNNRLVEEEATEKNNGVSPKTTRKISKKVPSMVEEFLISPYGMRENLLHVSDNIENSSYGSWIIENAMPLNKRGICYLSVFITEDDFAGAVDSWYRGDTYSQGEKERLAAEYMFYTLYEFGFDKASPRHRTCCARDANFKVTLRENFVPSLDEKNKSYIALHDLRQLIEGRYRQALDQTKSSQDPQEVLKQIATRSKNWGSYAEEVFSNNEKDNATPFLVADGGIRIVKLDRKRMPWFYVPYWRTIERRQEDQNDDLERYVDKNNSFNGSPEDTEAIREGIRIEYDIRSIEKSGFDSTQPPFYLTYKSDLPLMKGAILGTLSGEVLDFKTSSALYRILFSKEKKGNDTVVLKNDTGSKEEYFLEEVISDYGTVYALNSPNDEHYGCVYYGHVGNELRFHNLFTTSSKKEANCKLILQKGETEKSFIGKFFVVAIKTIRSGDKLLFI